MVAVAWLRKVAIAEEFVLFYFAGRQGRFTQFNAGCFAAETHSVPVHVVTVSNLPTDLQCRVVLNRRAKRKGLLRFQ